MWEVGPETPLFNFIDRRRRRAWRAAIGEFQPWRGRRRGGKEEEGKNGGKDRTVEGRERGEYVYRVSKRHHGVKDEGVNKIRSRKERGSG